MKIPLCILPTLLSEICQKLLILPRCKNVFNLFSPLYYSSGFISVLSLSEKCGFLVIKNELFYYFSHLIFIFWLMLLFFCVKENKCIPSYQHKRHKLSYCTNWNHLSAFQKTRNLNIDICENIYAKTLKKNHENFSFEDKKVRKNKAGKLLHGNQIPIRV